MTGTKLVQKRNSVSVYCGDSIMCQIDNDFAIKAGYKTAMEYCEKVFLEDPEVFEINQKIVKNLEAKIEQLRNTLDMRFGSVNSHLEYSIKLTERFISFVENKAYEFLSFEEATASFNMHLLLDSER